MFQNAFHQFTCKLEAKNPVSEGLSKLEISVGLNHPTRCEWHTVCVIKQKGENPFGFSPFATGRSILHSPSKSASGNLFHNSNATHKEHVHHSSQPKRVGQIANRCQEGRLYTRRH
jgi:hypothetical protein